MHEYLYSDNFFSASKNSVAALDPWDLGSLIGRRAQEQVCASLVKLTDVLVTTQRRNLKRMRSIASSGEQV